jgi:chaperonin GroES
MFQPTGNRVVLTLDELSEKTEGGLYVPQSASPSEGPKKATVVSVSEGYIVNGIETRSKFFKGDRVLVDALGGANVRIEGADYLVVRNEDILGKFIA